ncbi:MAG: feoA [Anaerocolumna sp.]|jgi:ferrous iron transport protein A|nr:feoA [Anaerocolumna sp.]
MEVLYLQLHELTVGDKAYIDKLTSLNALRERMLALGLTKGTTIEAIRKGPAGDPTIYNIRGAMIALRKEEASLIHIVKTKEALMAAAISLDNHHNSFELPDEIHDGLHDELTQKEKDHKTLEVLDGLNLSIYPE